MGNRVRHFPIAIGSGHFACVPRHGTAQTRGEMPTILLVDDDPLQASVHVSALETRFRKVRRVADVVEALCLVEDESIASHLELVISGHHRPGMSGPEFVAELHSRLPNVPVLVLDAGEEEAREYRKLGGAVAFVGKPVTAKNLVQAVSDILARGFRNVA